MRVLRLFHSAVVPEFLERERLLRARHGWDVHVACPPVWNEGGSVVTASVDPDPEVPVHILPIHGRRHPILFWYSQRALRALMRELQPDIVDVHEEPYSLAARGIVRAAAREVPNATVVIYTAQNLYKRYPLFFRRSERKVLRRAAAAYPCSTEAGQVLRRKGYGGPLYVLPLGVSPAPPRPDANGRLRVGFVSRLVPEKGGRLAVEAFARASRGLDATLEIVGSGPDEPSLRALAGDNVVFTGAIPQHEALEHISSYDVLLAPSLGTKRWKEQFGRVVAQALAAGTPVIASDSGSLPEVLGGAAEIVPEGDADALANTLSALLRDAGRREQLASLGRERAAEALSWNRVAEGFDSMYRESHAAVLDDRAARRPAKKRRAAVATEPLRVALVNHSGRLGGGEFSMLRLADALDPDRVKLTVIAGEDGPFVERLHELGADVVVVPMDTQLVHRRKDTLGAEAFADGQLWRQIGEAVRPRTDILRRSRIQIVHTNSMKAHVLGGISGRMAGAKVLWHVRDHVAPPYLPPTTAYAMRAAARMLPHHVITVSHSVARTIGRRDATVIHQSVPLPQLGPERTNPSPVRIGLVGRIAPWKGQDVFLDAAELLAPRFPDTEFVVVGSALFGEDELERSLRARAERLPLRGRVSFLGFCNDMDEVYRGLDVAVHASTLAEPYGNVVLEAMASRVATVAAAEGGPLEIVEHDRTGLLVPPRDPRLLADALESLLLDPQKRMQLARAAREHVERNFSLQRDGLRLQRLYERLAA
ncbi:MAG TPA: glycosyltransferase family 4 protein [Gaiellaceae bacterium]|nr:glycosyltransferase family 4 protein [Gaiellaceae bacterium]